jgi:2-polyprenyl-3-methyl-5-hydroxy-6-metoxy-1,4-benzoquinol methylase
MPVATSSHEYCPICEGRNLDLRWKIKGYSIVQCQGCSLVFVREILTNEQLAAHYASGGDVVYADDNRDCLDYYYHELRKQIEARVPAKGRIFDVGCSGGWFLEAMQGWDCYGCEIAPQDAVVAQQRFGERVFTGTLEDYPSPDNWFDVITMQDVFDHCPEPLTVLGKCRRMLKPGGLLVIKVHNISCLYAKMTGAGFYALLPPSHLFYYDRRTLGRVTERAGLKLVDARFIAHLLKVSTVFHRLARERKDSIFHRGFLALKDTGVGQLKIRKNLHDIITVFAVKPALTETPKN